MWNRRIFAVYGFEIRKYSFVLADGANTGTDSILCLRIQAKGAGFAFYKGVVVVLMYLVMFCPLWVGGLLLVRWLIKTSAARPTRPVPPPPPPMQV